MYENIGKKIKTFAQVCFLVMAIVTFIAGAVVLSLDGSDTMNTIGALLMLLGPVVSWISSWMLYAFGELVDKTCEIEKKLCGEAPAEKSETKLD